MRLGTFSMQGISTKVNEAVTEIESYGLDIVSLTETRKRVRV